MYNIKSNDRPRATEFGTDKINNYVFAVCGAHGAQFTAQFTPRSPCRRFVNDITTVLRAHVVIVIIRVRVVVKQVARRPVRRTSGVGPRRRARVFLRRRPLLDSYGALPDARNTLSPMFTRRALRTHAIVRRRFSIFQSHRTTVDDYRSGSEKSETFDFNDNGLNKNTLFGISHAKRAMHRNRGTRRKEKSNLIRSRVIRIFNHALERKICPNNMFVAYIISLFI